MISVLVGLFLTLLVIYCGSYLVYFVHAKRQSKRQWTFEIDTNYQPKISILVPAHNEESSIESKLRNIKDVEYPKQNIEVIVADDASSDRTLAKVESFILSNPDLDIRIVRQNPRAGKSAALNKALEVSANHLVILTDADTLWACDILQKALPYMADSRVGALTGKGVNWNADESWVTKSENTYLSFMSLVRLYESKTYSTIRFEGGFCAYKKEAFDRFDTESGADDAGTALEVVQNNYRSIFVPEAVFHTRFPARFVEKLRTKIRRANQLMSLWTKCLRLMLKRRLVLPKRIALPEIAFFIVSPMIAFALMSTMSMIIILSPFSPFSISILLMAGILLLLARGAFAELLLGSLILLYAFLEFLFGRRYTTWEKS